MRWSAVIGIALIAACSTIDMEQSVAISYLYEDVPMFKELRISYTNRTNKTMCLTPDNWPNAAGKLDQASSRVSVEVEGTVHQYRIRDFNTGYCPKCAEKVQPGDTLIGAIPYSEFSIPKSEYSAKKFLHFQPYAFPCE